jgi:precorrin-6x reductase
MSTWVILSWVAVAVLTGVNIYIFLKLKSASEQMLKMAFPGAKDMNEALSQMQRMMAGMPKNFGKNGLSDPRLQAAMRQMQHRRR